MEGTVLINCDQEASIIADRLEPLFTAQWHCQYRIDIVNNQYGSAFNFFLDIRHKNHRERSIPLHTVHATDLAVLERIVVALKKHTQLSLNFVNFGRVRWPESQRWVR